MNEAEWARKYIEMERELSALRRMVMPTLIDLSDEDVHVTYTEGPAVMGKALVDIMEVMFNQQPQLPCHEKVVQMAMSALQENHDLTRALFEKLVKGREPIEPKNKA